MYKSWKKNFYLEGLNLPSYLKITSIAPRNLFLGFKVLYVFLWRYDLHDIIYACRYNSKDFAKKFWATFVAQLLRNKCNCENWILFFAHFRSRAKIACFKYDQSVVDTLYFISEDFNTNSIHQKILVDVDVCWCNIFLAWKKNSRIFEKFFWIYNVSDVPVVHQQVLMYCC